MLSRIIFLFTGLLFLTGWEETGTLGTPFQGYGYLKRGDGYVDASEQQGQGVRIQRNGKAEELHLGLEDVLAKRASGNERDGFTTAEIDTIVKKHNKLRRGVSPPSSDMQMMMWDDKLARRAQASANRCVFRHSTSLPLGMGENIYGSTSRPPPSIPVQKWFSESEDYTYSKNKCKRGKKCGHYTQVVWAENNKVGCGIKKCSSGWLVFCNYSPGGNVIGQRPYQTGGTCQLCPNSAPACEKGLCSTCKPGKGSCECHRTCQNCGELTNKCTCTCPPGFIGEFCERECTESGSDCHMVNNMWCNMYETFKQECPIACGLCSAPSQAPRCRD